MIRSRSAGLPCRCTAMISFVCLVMWRSISSGSILKDSSISANTGSAPARTVAALGIGPGDEVILPAWTWHSCFNAIVLAGALPVIAEIDESFNIDPDDIESKITPLTKVIMAAHLQGNSCDIEGVLAVARKHRLKVVEDCAQSV